jgi:hypothetical protein
MAMLRSLAAEARAGGVEQLVGDVMWENVAMIGLAERMGCTVRMHPADTRLLQVTQDLRAGRLAGSTPANRTIV